MARALLCSVWVGLATAVACGGSPAPSHPAARIAPHLRRSAYIALASAHERRFEHEKTIASLAEVCERNQDFELCRRAIAAKKMPTPKLPRVASVCPDGIAPAPAVVLTVTLPGAFVDGIKIKPRPEFVAEALSAAPPGPLAIAVDDRVTASQFWPLALGVAGADRKDVALAVQTPAGRVAMRIGAIVEGAEARVVARPDQSLTELATALAEGCPAPSVAMHDPAN